MVFHWGLSDSKSPQVSRTLLSILAVFNNTGAVLYEEFFSIIVKSIIIIILFL